MNISKKISAMILSLVLVISSFGTANAAKRLTAAVADWTGGEISCQVAVTMLEEELGYKIKRVVFHLELAYGKPSQLGKLTLLVKAGQVMLKQTL